MLKNPGAHLANEREEIVQSFVTVLPKRKSRERVDRGVTYLLRCLAEELWHLPELQPIYSLQFQRITAESAREQIALQKAQLQALTNLGLDVREALLQLTDAIAEQKLLAVDNSLVSLPPIKVYHNLPQPDYTSFVGREIELAEIHRILRPYPHSQIHLVTIDGIGGIGKSTLALEVAHHYLRNYDNLSTEDRFEAIIWTSAKQTILTAGGIISRPQILRTLDDIYTAIAITLQREDITSARPGERDEVVRRALTQQRTLLIIDNLETVDDKTVLSFLRELPAPTKAIVTTRHRLDVAYPVRLVGMPWGDAQLLIAQECEKKNAILSRDEAERLYKRTGGVPLALVWSIAQMGFGYSVQTVLDRLDSPTNDIARFCFEESIARIQGKPAHDLLMALCLFATDASRQALGEVAGLGMGGLSRDEGLVTLETLSLVNKDGNRFSLLPLTRSYLQKELEQVPEITETAFIRMAIYYKQVVMPPSEHKVGVAYWDGLHNYALIPTLRQEWSNLVRLIHWLLDKQRYAEALDLFLPVVHLLNALGLWDDRVELSREMCAAANIVGDSSEAWLWIDAIAWILGQRQQLDESISALNAGRLVARQFDMTEALMLADIFEAAIYLRQGDIKLARQIINPTLTQIDLSSIVTHENRLYRIVAARAISWAASLSQTEGDYNHAEELFKLELALRPSIGEGGGSTLTRLARISLKLGDVVAAEEYLAQASKSSGHKEVAWINYCQALIAIQKGDLQRAQSLCQLALTQFTRLGLKEGVEDTQQLLEHLQVND